MATPQSPPAAPGRAAAALAATAAPPAADGRSDTAPPALPSWRAAGELRWLALAALAYFVLTAAIFQPTPARLAASIVANPGDPLLNVCLIDWVAASARRGFADLWSPPFYFPTRGVLALADDWLGPGVLAALLPSAAPRGLLVYNLLVLLSFPLGATFTAFVLRRTGLPPLAAFLGGLAFGFSPYRWSRLSHGQVLLAHWIPLLLWLWDRLLAAPRPRLAVAFVAVHALHVTGGAYLAYMAHVPLLVIALVRLRHHGRDLLRRDTLRVLLPTGLACALVATAVFGPYLLISQRLGLTRSPREALMWAGTLLSYVTPDWSAPYAGPWLSAYHRAENELFAGFLPTALAALGLALAIAAGPPTERSPWQRAALAVPLLTALLALVIADTVTLRGTDELELGAWTVSLHGFKGPGWLLLASVGVLLWLRRRWRAPGGSWWALLPPWERGLLLAAAISALLTLPVVYLPVREVLPGLSGMRVPPRFYPFVSLGIAYLLARGVAALLAGRSHAFRAALGGVAVALLCCELLPRPLPFWHPMPDRRADAPVAHRWLADHRGEVGAYYELPIADDSTELLGMYFQTAHWVPMVNGYSGYFPRRPQELRRCCSGPGLDDDDVRQLVDAGVTHLMLSEWKMKWEEAAAWRQLERRLVRDRIATRELRHGASAVLALRPPSQWRPAAQRPPGPEGWGRGPAGGASGDGGDERPRRRHRGQRRAPR